MEEISDNLIMPFGKYKGQKIGNVPAQYLLYLYRNNIVWGDVKRYVVENQELLEKEAAKND